ncbi:MULTISPECIES: hypothetical protein [Enterobacter cloacae complex]|uniref:hypothetical protein n=1 Tax=Enterobacter cloacae complex TaxID=354276 RepID=UPI0013CFC1E3|nr:MULTISPECIES: hypothetical protein [Enterobacter cloacae complex]MBG0579363.1 hypothetical protein [Enterobacter kobei]
MKKLIFVMLIGLCSFGVMAQTSCMQDPAGNLQCTGFNDDGEMIQSTTTQTPNGNYETNGVDGDRSFSSTCYTTPGGSWICN